jgi:FMN phosphatase YigB (HAD superfamily)
VTRGVLWDLGGVLCRFLPDRRRAALADASGCSESDVDACLTPAVLAALDSGQCSGLQLLEHVRATLRWDCTYDDLADAWSCAFEPDDFVLSLAAGLRPPIRSALLTDNGPVLRDGFERRFPKVVEVVDDLAFSFDYGLTKPSPELYLAACDLIGVPPEQTLLIDDSRTNVEEARVLGLDGIQYVDAGRLEHALRQRGLLA